MIQYAGQFASFFRWCLLDTRVRGYDRFAWGDDIASCAFPLCGGMLILEIESNFRGARIDARLAISARQA
jgi:hypothetical protein